MNIFLDSNVFHTDPFLQKGEKPILLRLAQHEDVKLFINETVYSEVERHHKSFLEREIKSAQDALSKLTPFLNKDRETMDISINFKNLMDDFSDFFQELGTEEQMAIIGYDADVLKHIVKMDMYEEVPFIKQEIITNKQGDKVTKKKKEMRDAIIWYSIQEYIEKNTLEDCYFISNNIKEFGADGASKTPQEEPYPLHPAIAEKSKITAAYRNVHDFLTHNSETVKELFTDTSLHSRILSGDLLEQVEKELKDGLAEQLVENFLTNEIIQHTHDYILEKDPDDIHSDYFMGGYVDPESHGQITDIGLQDVDVYGESITVSIDLEVEMDVDIYLYNPVYDDKEEKFQFYGTDTVTVAENVIFLIPLNESKEIDSTNFSLQEYIDGQEPGNVNVEIIEMKTTTHEEMFPDFVDDGLDLNY
ncbi:PIN domain-containing protein [Priestia megaterium]